MIVICCGMLRSGSTVQYQLTDALLRRSGKGKGLGWIGQGDCIELEGGSGEWKAVKVHHYSQLRNVASLVEQGKALCIYSYRDVRDALSSLLQLRNEKFDSIMHGAEVRRMLSDFKAWTAFKSTLVTRYEVMVNSLPEEVLRISAHLGISISRADAVALAEEHSLEKQKERAARLRREGIEVDHRPFDRGTLLHLNHIQSGKSGIYDGFLTPLQVAYVESLSCQWLQTHGYPLSKPVPLRWVSMALPLDTYLGKIMAHLREGSLAGAVKAKWQSARKSPRPF